MNKAISLLAASVMAVTAGSAMAETNGWYLGVGAGQSKYSDWVSGEDMLSVLDVMAYELDVYALDGSIDSDSEDKDVGYKVFGGYQFGKNLAIEASYIDLGEVTASADASGYFYSDYQDFDGSMSADISAQTEAFTLDALLTLPVADIAQIFFKAGVYRAETDIKVSVGLVVDGDRFGESDTQSESSTGAHFGLGANFFLTENISLRAEWERLSKVEFDDTDSDLDLLSASLIYQF